MAFKQISAPSRSFEPSAGAAAFPASARGYAPAEILPADRSTAIKPALVDQAADFDIPRLWSTWKEDGKPRAIVRAITDSERIIVQTRANTLRLSTMAFVAHEEDRAIAAISFMLGGFRSMRQGDEDAAAVLEGIRRVLAPFPLWAIEQGCLLIQSGEAWLDGLKLTRRFPPNDSEICGVIKEIVKPYRDALEKAQALLAAPIEELPRRPAAR